MAGIPEGGFTSRKQLEAWLNGLSSEKREFAPIIAHRAALRTLLFSPEHRRILPRGTSDGPDFALTLFRLYAISRAEIMHLSFREWQREVATSSKATNTARNFVNRLGFSISSVTLINIAIDSSETNRASFFGSRDYNALAIAATFRAVNACSVEAAKWYGGHGKEFATATSFVGQALNDVMSTILHAVSNDASNLVTNGPSAALASPLWPDGTPNWWQDIDRDFRRVLTDQKIWSVWLEWWQARVDGAPSWGLPPALEQEVETHIALGDGRKDFWDRDPSVVNAEIAEWVADARKKAAAGEAPEIPPSKAASLRPHWINGKLENDRKLITNLPAEQIYGLFQSVKKDLNGLARKAADDVRNSVHKDAVKLLRETAALIAKDGPDFPALCRLSVKEEVLLVYLATVDTEWPNLLAAEYRAISFQLSKALDQADAIKAFKRNAIEADLEAATDNSIPASVTGLSNELKKLENKPFIGKSVTDALDAAAESAIIPDPQAGGISTVPVRASYDALESSNNLLKELVIKAHEGGHVAAGQAEYEKAFADNYIEAAKKAGKDDAEFAAKWAGRSILGRKAIQLIGNDLARRYPRMFGWFAIAVPEHDGPEIDLDANPPNKKGSS